MLLGKEFSRFRMFESKLWHNRTETKNVKVAKMAEFIKACDQYSPRFIWSFFLLHCYSEEIDNFLLFEGNDKILGDSFTWGPK